MTHEISEISICPYLVLALCRIHRTRALSDCLSVLALSAVALALSSALSLSAGQSALGSLRWLSALWRWLLAQRSLSAGLSALGSLRWLSVLWRYAQHWLSVLGLGA